MTEPNALRLQIMGPLRIWRGGTELEAGPRQQRCLLALLIAHEGRPVSRTDLIDQMWGSTPPVSAVNAIHKYVGALRRLMEPNLVPRSAGSHLTRYDTGYRFSAGPETLDLIDFRRSVAQAKDHAGRNQPEEALDRYVEALHHGQGPAGDTLGDSAAATAAFAGIDGEFFDAAVAAAEIASAVGRPSRVLPALRLAARMGRMHEPVHAALITTLAAAGHQAEALDAYRNIRERLADELGIDPGRGLQEAQRRVLTQAVAPPLEEAAPLAAELTQAPLQLPPDQPVPAGRAHELPARHDLFRQMPDSRRTSPTVVRVDGIGGVGKSRIVTRIAHQVAGEFNDVQLYLDLRNNQRKDRGVPTADVLRSLLYAMGLRAADGLNAFDALVGTYRSLTAEKRILVLPDDVRDAAQVHPLPPSPPGVIPTEHPGPTRQPGSSGREDLERASLPARRPGTTAGGRHHACRAAAVIEQRAHACPAATAPTNPGSMTGLGPD
jgi:DNA-binding SARP family transcriptional activator